MASNHARVLVPSEFYDHALLLFQLTQMGSYNYRLHIQQHCLKCRNDAECRGFLTQMLSL